LGIQTNEMHINIFVEGVIWIALGDQKYVGRPRRIGQSSGIAAQSLEYVLTL